MLRITSASLTLLLALGCGGAQPGPASNPHSASQTPGSEASTGNAEQGPSEESDGLTRAVDPEQPSDADESWGIRGPSYASVVERVTGMVGDPAVIRGAERRGLSVLNVMWEDTARAQGSSLGPNISDLTLQVRYRPGAGEAESTALLPVIRFPNFTDRTADIRADRFYVRVGNHRDKSRLTSVPLTDVLKNLRGYLSKPWSVRGSGNLLSKKDSHFLVSAQAVFLPIPKQGKAEFNPVLFNYQSAPGSPAVLAILVTRQGTSISVVENSPEEATTSGYGQELYFNNEGQRAAFTAERKTDVEQRIGAQGGPMTADDRSALARGADALFLVQVPLKHRQRGYLGGLGAGMAPSSAAGAPTLAESAAPMASAKRERSDVEQAVLGHGKNRGPFSEGNELLLERDPNFPIRITVQFYKATSNGVVDNKDLDNIATSIGQVYEHADFVGSLVLPDGDPARPTAWQTMPSQWFPW